MQKSSTNLFDSNNSNSGRLFPPLPTTERNNSNSQALNIGINMDYRVQAANYNRILIMKDADGNEKDLDGELLKFYNQYEYTLQFKFNKFASV